MKKKVFITIGIIITTIMTFLLFASYKDTPVLAQVSCPPSINPDSLECLDYLRSQLGLLQNQQGSIQKQLKNEEYQQLSLQEKISYINNQIFQTEQVIKSLQIEIAANDIEINMLEENIKEKEDSISLLKQEINVLSEAVTKRITESYKYSFINQFEILLDITNISSILRKSKYLAMTRSQDKKSLEKYSTTVVELKREEAVLSENKMVLKIKRDSREEEKVKLAESKSSLDTQKRQREVLLAESKAKQAELLALYQQNMKRVVDLDAAIATYINTHESEIVDEGWVTTSTPIGRMGNTGCSGGSHLHLGLNSGKQYPKWGYFWSDINLFDSGYLRKTGTIFWPLYAWNAPILASGSARIPFNGNYVFMHQTEHQGNAIDLASYRSMDWGSKIEGAPIYPIMAGRLYKGTEGVCGGKYARVMHSNGMVSIYLHMQ